MEHSFFFFSFFIFSRNETRTIFFFFYVSPYLTAAGTAGGERMYGFRLCLDGRTEDGRFTLCFSVAGKSSTEKISSHDDVYIFAKLYKVALIVKSSGNHDNALTHQEVLPCGWAGRWAGVRWGLKKRGKKIKIKQVESGGSKTTNKQLK